MSEYIKNKETGKIELHFDKSEYIALSNEDKQMIKGAFLFSRYSSAWVSRGKFPSYSYIRAEEVAKKLGIEDGGEVGETLSFAEQMQVKAEKAEHRADKYDYKSNKAQKIGNEYQKPINDMHGDISFFTQPNINTSAGRAFTNRRNKMWSMWERGFEEFKKSEYYAERAEAARNTAAMTKPKDKAFCYRRIKEAESSIKKIKKSIDAYNKFIEQLNNGEKPKNEYGWEMDLSIDRCQRQIESWSEMLDMEISKATYYYDCIEELGGIQFSKDNINVGDVVKMDKWYKGKVVITGTGKVNFTYRDIDGSGFELKGSYAEIVEVIKKADTEKIHHPFKVGEKYTVSYFVYDEPNSFSSKGHTEIKEYTVTKITPEKVTFKHENERAITKKPIRYANNGIVGFAIQLIQGRDGRIRKEISKEEALNLGI